MIKKYVEVEVVETKRIPIEEVIDDGIEFFKMMGFIDICNETNLSIGPKEAIDVYNQTVVDVDILANKYGLHDMEIKGDPWYELNILWPKMEKFFKEHIIVCK